MKLVQNKNAAKYILSAAEQDAIKERDLLTEYPQIKSKIVNAPNDGIFQSYCSYCKLPIKGTSYGLYCIKEAGMTA